MLPAVKYDIKYFCVLFQTALLINISTPAQNKTNVSTNFPEPIFEHITIADGLPENSVFSMLQDHFGYLWLGTQNGLVRYDGYNMKVFTRDPNDSLSISDRTITAIYEDKSRNLWIGTPYGGLNRFDRKKETFIKYMHDAEDSTSIASNFILCINEDKNENILVGTMRGLALLLKSANSFRTIKKITDNGNKISLTKAIEDILVDSLTENIYVSGGNEILIYDSEKELLRQNDFSPRMGEEFGLIHSFHQAKDGTIWIGHSNGLARFNSLNNVIRCYQLVPSRNFINGNFITKIAEDDKGYIWGATNHFISNPRSTLKGLICFNPLDEEFNRYEYDSQNKSSISDDDVNLIFKDKSGVIWVGSWSGGLNKWDSKKQKFKQYSYDSINPKGKLFGIVYSMAEDPEGNIWLGTENLGLYSFNRLSNKFKNIWSESKNYISDIYIDNNKTIWFGTPTKGLVKFDQHNKSFHFYAHNSNDSTTISNNEVTSILPDGKNILWIGTDEGLNRFDKKTGKFTCYKNNPENPQSLGSNRTHYIYKDLVGSLWIGTNTGGLNKFNPVDETFKSFHFTKGIGVTTVEAIYEDKAGNFWVGTFQSGVHLFDRVKETSVYNITERDGLANNQVMSILEDDSGNLWIGTNNGLSKFNPQTHSIKNFYSPDGVDQNRFRLNALKTSSGELMFGTYDGFIMFHPDSIKDDLTPPQVVIINVSPFKRPDDRIEYEGFISELKELNLSYYENDLRFDYVGLHFGDPSKNQYKYMLENFDDDWIDAGTQRNAVYTNLDAGEYVFRVKASNLDGVWNEEGAALKIIIPPPFWATWWAYSFYVLFVLSVLYSIRRYELGRTYLKNQLKIDEVKLKEKEEIDRMKSRFFANISHEFRTPVTLILGPAEKINRDSPGEEVEKQTNLIKRNAKRLLGLINQLLDLSKLEAGKLELRASRSNIVSFIKGITMSFESIAERKDITLKVKSSSYEIELYFDKDKMTKIMTNLFSNSFKFTPEGGQITVTVNQSENNSVFIKVSDTGIGISGDELPRLFDRFYQVDSSFTKEYEGTGLGLALTKELVELHHGTISATSEVGKGTEFIVMLPFGRNHLKDEEIIEENVILTPDKVGGKNLTQRVVDDIIQVDPSSFVLSRIPQYDNEINEGKNVVLIVEDNSDVREYIKDSIGDEFQIEEASNGEQGVRKAKQIIPDLIISDIMMPKMDGNELTVKLKNDEMTSHIPIILLTAKSEEESKLEGLETGADDYLTKPFNTKELQIRISNLVSIRKKLQEKYSKEDFTPAKSVEAKKLSNLDEQFMCKVMEVIENHISEEDFSIEQFGKEVGMSRVQLHRKLKALSGKSASNYLRSVRLSKAKQMIKEQKGNISEIAYSVGFSSPQYFARCFKEEFGFPPSDFTN